MATTISDLQIANNALARIGEGSIASFDEESPLARQVSAIYRDRIDVLFSWPWNFSRRTYKLQRMDETPDNGWKYAFALPSERLSPPRTVLRDPRQPKNPFRDYAVEGGNLYADIAELWATVSVRVDPSLWPPSFRILATVAAAADLCVPVTHDKDLADQLRGEAYGLPSEGGRGGLMARAIADDIATSPIAAPLSRDPLTDARLS